MVKVFKYDLALTGIQKVSIPVESEILSVQVQKGKIVFWAAVNTLSEKHELTISLVGTGQEIPDKAVTYIGTVQLDGFVWHVFHN